MFCLHVCQSRWHSRRGPRGAQWQPTLKWGVRGGWCEMRRICRSHPGKQREIEDSKRRRPLTGKNQVRWRNREKPLGSTVGGAGARAGEWQWRNGRGFGRLQRSFLRRHYHYIILIWKYCLSDPVKWSKRGNGELVRSPGGRNCFYNTFDRWLFLKIKAFFPLLTIGISTSIKIYSPKNIILSIWTMLLYKSVVYLKICFCYKH